MTDTLAKEKRILVMAGGTGGHVFPALAVARYLRDRGVQVQWLGTRRGLEASVVPAAGFDIAYINITGLRGKGALGWLLAPFKLLLALWQGLQVVRHFKPHAALGMGGFVTGPGGVAAWISRVPLLVHEQNAIAGLTNKLLAPLAKVVMEAFPGAIAPGKAQHTGNPVRQDIVDLYDNEPQTIPADRAVKVLVVGGSLGAQALNSVVPEAAALLKTDLELDIRHQTGKNHIDLAQKHYHDAGVQGQVLAFIDDMAEAYRWADLVICRAGAMTVSELAVAGVASILVPFPFAVDDHQTSNARYLSDKGAALLVQQRDLTPQLLADMIKGLSRERLFEMAVSAKALALPIATEVVAKECLMAMRG